MRQAYRQTRPGRAGRHRRQRARGAIIVVMLLAVTLLAGIVLFAYNLSDQINRRVDMQNVADATVISGSTWMAKSNNVIAMNNVGQVKLMSLAPILDAMPLAAEVALRDLDSSVELAQGLRDQLARGVPDSRVELGTQSSGSGWQRVNFLREGLEKLEAAMTPEQSPRQQFPSHYQRLEELDEALDSEDEYQTDGGLRLRDLTYWDGGQGQIWQAAIAMDELSQATVDTAGLLAQANAASFGERNGAATAFLTPILPQIPARRGQLSHFYPSLVGRFTVNQESDYAQLQMPIYGQVNRINSIDRRLEQIAQRIVEIQQELARLDPNDTNEANDIVRLEAELSRLSSEWINLEYRKEDIFRSLHNTCPGGGIVDWQYPQRLGPYAKLHRWRHPLYRGGTSWQSGGGADPLSPATGVHVGGNNREEIGYRTYGPYRWALDRLHWRMGVPGGHTGPVSATRFVYFHQWISNIKLGYAFGVQRPQRVKFPTEWITDFDEARAFVQDPANRGRILRTRYYRVTVKSRLSWDHPDWLKPPAARNQDPPTAKTYHSRDGIEPFDSPPSSRWIWEPRGWWDVEPWLARQSNGSWDRVNNYCWRWQRSVEVAFDPEIGYPYPPVDQDGDPNNDDEERIKYIVTWWVFGGLQIGEESPPVAALSWPGPDDIAPMLLDTTVGDYDPALGPADNLSAALTYSNSTSAFPRDIGVRRSHFAYLGVAHRENRSRVWQQQFQTVNPLEGPVAVAQAEVFNNQSWDLWTQDWQTQLVPVSDWNDWGQRLRQGRDDLSAVGTVVDTTETEALMDFLESLTPELFTVFGSH